MKKESSKFKFASGSFYRMSGFIPVNGNKEYLLSLSFSILASSLAWSKKKQQLGNDFWLSIRTILSILSVLLKNKL